MREKRKTLAGKIEEWEEKRLGEEEEEGEEKIRVKRRGVGGLGGQKYGGAFVGEKTFCCESYLINAVAGAEWKGPPIGCVLLLVAVRINIKSQSQITIH